MKIQIRSIIKKTRILARIKKSSQNASISGKVAFWDDFFIRAKMCVSGYKKRFVFSKNGMGKTIFIYLIFFLYVKKIFCNVYFINFLMT